MKLIRPHSGEFRKYRENDQINKQKDKRSEQRDVPDWSPAGTEMKVRPAEDPGGSWLGPVHPHACPSDHAGPRPVPSSSRLLSPVDEMPCLLLTVPSCFRPLNLILHGSAPRHGPLITPRLRSSHVTCPTSPTCSCFSHAADCTCLCPVSMVPFEGQVPSKAVTTDFQIHHHAPMTLTLFDTVGF